MISLVDPSELENVLRPTVYNPDCHPELSEGPRSTRAMTEVPRLMARDDIRKTHPDQTADSRRY